MQGNDDEASVRADAPSASVTGKLEERNNGGRDSF